MVKTSVAFRSKPITSRNHQTKKGAWEPSGTFNFFDLPPELRTHIFNLLLDDPKFKGVLSLLLTSERMYSEVATMFYRDVLLDATSSRGLPDPFLTGAVTRVTPRRHVQSLAVNFYLKDHMHLFHERYLGSVRDMVGHGNLQSLRLEVHSRFPSLDFWGEVTDRWSQEHWLATGKRKDREVKAPYFVSKEPFQSFLRFLREANVPLLRLFVDANDHYEFWCPFHPAHPAGVDECGGEWKGQSRRALLEVDWRGVVKVFAGAKVLKPAR